jgi:hypothetical protein
MRAGTRRVVGRKPQAGSGRLRVGLPLQGPTGACASRPAGPRRDGGEHRQSSAKWRIPSVRWWSTATSVPAVPPGLSGLQLESSRRCRLPRNPGHRRGAAAATGCVRPALRWDSPRAHKGLSIIDSSFDLPGRRRLPWGGRHDPGATTPRAGASLRNAVDVSLVGVKVFPEEERTSSWSRGWNSGIRLVGE